MIGSIIQNIWHESLMTNMILRQKIKKEIRKHAYI